MSAGFDPYHKWLGIPREEQPPHFYRLLGLQLFESDRDVIANACDQRMALLKTFAIGNNGALSEDLLNEVARARVFLLNPTKRLAYDVKLRDQLAGFSSQSDETNDEHSAAISALHAAWDSGSVTSAGSDSKNVNKSSQASRVDCVVDSQSNNRQPGPDTDATTVDQSQPDTASWFPDFTTSETPSIASYPRARTRRSPSVVISLVAMLFTGFIGLAAGYFVLCVIDVRYDFLHLLNIKTANENTNSTKLPDTDKAIPHRTMPPRTSPRKTEEAPVLPPPRNPNLSQVHRPTIQPKLNVPPTPAVQRRPNPFGKFPPELPIPKNNDLPDPTPLASVPIGDLEDFQLSLVVDSDNQRVPLSLELQDQDSHSPIWIVHTTGDSPLEIANFSIKNNDLRFNWSRRPDRTSIVAMRNAVLRIQANGYEHFVSLREPILVEAHVIELEKAVDRALSVCDDLPEPASLRLDILEVTNSPKFDVEGVGLLGMKVGDETIVRFRDAKEAATKFKFLNQRSQLLIEIESRYQLPSGARDVLDTKKLSRKIANVKNALTSKTEDSKLKGDLAALERIAKVAAELDKKATIKYRFYSVVAGHEVVLVTVP